MDRLLVPLPDPLPPLLEVSGEAFHHLAHVLRARAGLTVELFDGHGRSCPAVVEALGESTARLKPGAPRQAPRTREVTLLQGLPKGERWDWILQKGTELGATRFAPLATERTIVKLEPARARERQERWQKICQEAARQCGRSEVPEVWPLLPLPEALARLPPALPLLVLDEEERALNLRQALNPLEAMAPLAFSIGPEGGWTREEVALQERHGARAVTLGTRVLRTETASTAVLAVLAFLALE